MALPEDPATILEQFVQDIANCPAEIAHLLEEVQAKDKLVLEHRKTIDALDNGIQKHVKTHGSLEKHPKEDAHYKAIHELFDKCRVLSDEKIALAEKAFALLDRHTKRLDMKIRDLQNDGSMAFDPQLPSMLRESLGNKIAPKSSTSTGVNTPLHPMSANVQSGGANVANAAVARMAGIAAANSASTRATTATSSTATAGAVNSPVNTTTTATAVNLAATGRPRDVSVGSEPSKRRRPNPTAGAVATPTSGLARQSSLGPGTPKPSAPGSRAGSAGPRPSKKTIKKVALKPSKKPPKGADSSKKPLRRVQGADKDSASTTADDESAVSGEDREEEDGENASIKVKPATQGDPMEVDEDEGDDTKYCTCQRVSFGDMVGCDNEACPYQWFHWECVGVKEEPQGEWLCPSCRELKPSQIKRAK